MSESKIPSGVIRSSLQFLRELKKHYGDEKVHKIWENLTDVIDDSDLKMEVFKAMLTGTTGGTNLILSEWDSSTVPQNSNYSNTKIPAIKLYRMITGLGLKESKDAIESVQIGQVHSKINVPISEVHFTGINTNGAAYSTEPDYHKWIKEAEDCGLSIEFI